MTISVVYCYLGGSSGGNFGVNAPELQENSHHIVLDTAVPRKFHAQGFVSIGRGYSSLQRDYGFIGKFLQTCMYTVTDD